MSTCTCFKCGSSWLARVKHPVMCPICKRKDWDGEHNSLGRLAVDKDTPRLGNVPLATTCRCVKCDNLWVTRMAGKLPVSCPACKSRDWNKPRTGERLRCVKCNHEWAPRGEGVPVICPACKRHDWGGASAREVPCYRCGVVWVAPVSDATGKPAPIPERCPSCHWIGWNVECNPDCGWCGGVGCDRCQSEQPAPGCGVVASVVPPVIRRDAEGVLLPCFWCGGVGCEWCEGDDE